MAASDGYKPWRLTPAFFWVLTIHKFNTCKSFDCPVRTSRPEREQAHMQSVQAKAQVDTLYQEVYEHWDKKINHGAFMTRLARRHIAASLPAPVF
jgi:hypothetical protein